MRASFECSDTEGGYLGEAREERGVPFATGDRKLSSGPGYTLISSTSFFAGLPRGGLMMTGGGGCCS